MQSVYKLAIVMVVGGALLGCSTIKQSPVSVKKSQVTSKGAEDAFKNPFFKDDDDYIQKKLVDKLEKEKAELELQNAILLKALNERKKVVHKLPRGEVVQQFPEFEELIFDQAKTAYREKDESRLQEAVRILRANQPSSKKLEVMFFWLAKLQESKNLNSQALVTYDEFIKMFPESRYVPQAMYLKGKLYEKLNLKPQALKIYSDIRKLHPDSRERHFVDTKLKKLTAKDESKQKEVKRK